MAGSPLAQYYAFDNIFLVGICSLFEQYIVLFMIVQRDPPAPPETLLNFGLILTFYPALSKIILQQLQGLFHPCGIDMNKTCNTCIWAIMESGMCIVYVVLADNGYATVVFPCLLGIQILNLCICSTLSPKERESCCNQLKKAVGFAVSKNGDGMFSWEEFFAHLHRALPGLCSVFFCELSPWFGVFGLEYILPMIYVMWHGAQFGALGPDAELGCLPRFLLRVTPALTTAWWIYQAVLFAMWIPVANDLMRHQDTRPGNSTEHYGMQTKCSLVCNFGVPGARQLGMQRLQPNRPLQCNFEPMELRNDDKAEWHTPRDQEIGPGRRRRQGDPCPAWGRRRILHG